MRERSFSAEASQTNRRNCIIKTVIYYRFIRPVNVTQKKDIPAAAVSINTRQGVMLGYTAKAG